MTIELTHFTADTSDERVEVDTEPEDTAAPTMHVAPNLDQAHREGAERNQKDFMARMKERIAEAAARRCVTQPSDDR